MKTKFLNSINFQPLNNNPLINIELIPKTISILGCLSLFKELINELVLYSKNNKFEKVKLLVDF